jgi:hypothetical protein
MVRRLRALTASVRPSCSRLTGEILRGDYGIPRRSRSEGETGAKGPNQCYSDGF